MQVLVINCGSSSIKCALIDSSGVLPGALLGALPGARLIDVRVTHIGEEKCTLIVDGKHQTLDEPTTIESGLRLLLKQLSSRIDFSSINAVAHRVVHGGDQLRPIVIDDHAMSALEKLASLAPLHNPPAIKAINLLRQHFPSLPQVAVFDTAFHSSLPTRAREYALPRLLTQRLGIRRLGFHGISHASVMNAVARHLKVEPQTLRLISCHLGNGASVTAIEYGRSVETSMGMTPMEGLIMGSRAGDIDAGVLLQLLKTKEFDVDGLDQLLNNESGLQGLAGTHDMHDIEQRAANGDEASRLAMTLYAHRVRKYIGAYAAVMGGVDVIAFTGGIGENSTAIRHRIAQRLEYLGAVMDEDANRDVPAAHQDISTISTIESRTKLLVVPANEEALIANEAIKLLAEQPRPTRVRIPIKVSARHAHLTQATINTLFGNGYQLSAHSPLSQHGQFAAKETVMLIGPRGRIDHVRVLGPPRNADQIELSRTDEFALGIDAPVRISGDLRNTPGITLQGPLGCVTIPHGVISARRHIHMSTDDSIRWGVIDHDVVQVKIDSHDRDLTFGDVIIRVDPSFVTEMHLDTDEANAAGVEQGELGELLFPR